MCHDCSVSEYVQEYNLIVLHNLSFLTCVLKKGLKMRGLEEGTGVIKRLEIKKLLATHVP